MAPSPRKQPPSGTTPRKIAQATPTKATRTSPRKKAWASPPKATSKFQSDIFSADEFADLSNRSWAELMEEDSAASDDNRSKSERKCMSESRRKGMPRRLNATQTKPKFVRSLELTNEVFQQTSTRRSQRNKNATETVVTEVKVETTETVIEGSTLNTRKRCLSSASTIHEDISPTKRRLEDGSGKPFRKAARGRNLNTDSATSSPSSRKDHWEEPTLGWCSDESVLKRRSREIERAKEKEVYQRYVSEVPLRDRTRGVHPRTPNKLINFSRRSWDTQIKKWKRSLYEWAGEEPSDSVNTSFCSYTSDDAMSGKEDNDKELENTPVLKNIQITVRPEADNMASLLGKFDIDSQMGGETLMGDESTLKATNQKKDPTAPVDFSTMHQQD